jgi:hypothetical protein
VRPSSSSSSSSSSPLRNKEKKINSNQINDRRRIEERRESEEKQEGQYKRMIGEIEKRRGEERVPFFSSKQTFFSAP